MLNRLKIGTKIGASFALGLLFFVALSAISYRSTHQLIGTAERESHTYEVIGQIEDLLSHLKDAETGQRGYVITGDEKYLEPYNAAVRVLDGRTRERLRVLIQDNPTQQQRLETVDPIITAKLTELDESIRLRRQQGFTAAQKAVQTDRGSQLMGNIRRILLEMEVEERKLLKQRSQDAAAAAKQTTDSVTYGIPVYSLLLVLIGWALARHISRPLRHVSEVADRIGDGDLDVSVPTSDRQDEIGTLTRTFNQMITNLRDTNRRNDEQTWLKSNLADVGRMLQGQRDQEAVARQILSKLAPLIGAQQGVFYLMETDTHPPQLKLLSSYAYRERKHLANQFRLGEGLVGQCALEKQRILLTDVPSDYIRIASGLGEAPPLNIVVLPILFEQAVTGVMELASLQRFNEIQLTLLDEVSESIGAVLNTIAADLRTNELLQESQTLTEELQQQQDEIQESSRLLEEQTETLRLSEAQLKEQQEELQQTNEELQQLNEELEEKAQLLAEQKQEGEQKNQAIELARQAIEEKAAQLTLSSRYKSEFLANMSHELRTPLNSLLILARLLSENGDGNLTDKQVEYSRTIHAAGSDLLELINEILDLAKIESGTISIDVEDLRLTDLQQFLERTFQQVAHDVELEFRVELDPALPPSIQTDPKRLQQILKNLLSNAFKFTEHGSVTVQITPAADDRAPLFANNPEPMIAFAVTDTGVGIAPEKQAVIFEAFQQADGTTSRKYGGTGLGLSISRELAQRLGGRIELTSQPGQGSTFTLVLLMGEGREERGERDEKREGRREERSAVSRQPSAFKTHSQPPLTPHASTLTAPNEVDDDRALIQPGDRVLLIIEDDQHFARILMEMARQQGFRVLASLRSQPGLALAQVFKPDAIMLDIRLPDMDGWTVLDRLKHDPETRHIPVHILSVDDEQQRSLQLGAIAYLQKPVSPQALTQALVNIKGFVERPVKNLLVVEDDPVQAQSIRALIGNGDVSTTIVGTGAAALATLRSSLFDCVVLDLGLPDMTGFDLIEQIKQQPEFLRLPIIVYTGRELTQQQETQLRRLAETIIVKDVRSPERLLDETALFLHRVQAALPESKRQMLEQLHQSDPVLAHKKVLIVDDDVRNIFALTSLLERYQMQVSYAENGVDGIASLQNHPDIDVVLMDVMMPELDGYESTRAIRQIDSFRSLPIIALTAKAMQGDREKCLEAGASDYITKPVDTEQLLSLLRVWLYR
ncbi:response regulator [Stenomitos frigidus]|uniref:Circadian input-output histidine kinase CikA n=1 Tax=Stenomitos frigidus ULC18 TaxID=2107698 RepID=A0A2T1DU20_9CYAN|nr:response regulator [Stenomitos frigidus]PSB23999.1 two-component system sensor histidine kinase/response regulator [Stenomitos frigidus ULC18]